MQRDANAPNVKSEDMDLDDLDFEKEDALDRMSELMNLVLQKIQQLELAIGKAQPPSEPMRTPTELDDSIFAEKEAGRKKSRNSRETNLVKKTIRMYARERLDIDVKSSIEIWPVVDDGIARRYNDGDSKVKGPTNDEFVMDWSRPGWTQWTRDCTAIFGADFIAQHKAHGFPLIQHLAIDIGMVKNSFREYVLYLKRAYIGQKDDGIAAAEKKRRVAQSMRSNSRRKQLLERRIALLKHHRFPEESVEKIESLGTDGMSSEESEGEVGGSRTFKIKRIPWRSQGLTNWLHRIDGLPVRNVDNSVLMQRNSSRNRVISDLKSTRRKPVRSLPINWYRRGWLEGQDGRTKIRLDIQEEECILPTIDDFVPRPNGHA